MPTIVAFETLTELYSNLVQRYKKTSKTAFAFKPSDSQEYQKIPWSTVEDDVESLAAWMIRHGVEPGDRVAILSENRYEWAVVDLAMQRIGAINVALYTSLPAGQCEYILQDSGAKIFFVSTGVQLKKAAEVFDRCESLTEVVAFDEPRLKGLMEHPFVTIYDDALFEGGKRREETRDEIRARAAAVRAEDLATLVYTSGTTGTPKGAMLTHRNIVSNIKSAHEAIHINHEDRSLSFLPLSHLFERTCGYYAMIAAGAEIYYARSVDTVAADMVDSSPTIVISVPHLFSKIYNRVHQRVEEGSAIRQGIFRWALGIGERASKGERGVVRLQKKVADLLVFNKLKERTGGRIRFFVSGGAALPAEIGGFFMAAGLHILEGYGLTETSPILAANRYGDEKMGTVGKVINGVTVGIQRMSDNRILAQISGESYPTQETTEAGEIICKGPNIMRGYWSDEEATSKMIDPDGWLHTGDIGHFVEGRLKITDRIKHMIINEGGKNIYPGPIEDQFKTSRWMDQIVIVGEGKTYMAALIVPDFDVLETYAKERGLFFDSREELVRNEHVLKLYRDEIRTVSRHLASHEKIRDFRLLIQEFSVETGELTPTLKVKRRVIEERYSDLIDDLFAPNNGGG